MSCKTTLTRASAPKALFNSESSAGVENWSGLRGHPGIDLISDDQWVDICVTLKLTRRELRVARMLFVSRTRDSIADTLHISRHAVRQHILSLHNKLGVRDRVEMVLRIVQVRDELCG